MNQLSSHHLDLKEVQMQASGATKSNKIIKHILTLAVDSEDSDVLRRHYLAFADWKVEQHQVRQSQIM